MNFLYVYTRIDHSECKFNKSSLESDRMPKREVQTRTKKIGPAWIFWCTPVVHEVCFLTFACKIKNWGDSRSQSRM